MQLRFSNHPGRHERHLRRRHMNPLFGTPPPCVDRGELERAQSRDQRELKDFMQGFRELIQQASDLEPNVDSESVLLLKERLDQAYEQATGLAGDQALVKQAVVKLVGIIMQAVRRGAGTDPHALDELQQEVIAREVHFRLLEYPLVADLLAPDSPIGPEDLIPVLLCAEAEEVKAALQLFDPPHLSQMLTDASALLENMPTEGGRLDTARQRMAQIEGRLNALGVKQH